MEGGHFEELPREAETLIPGQLGSGVLDWNKDPSDLLIFTEEKPLGEEDQDFQMDRFQDGFQESPADSVVCDSNSRLVPNGFSRSCCADDIVAFVNAGCEDSSRVEAGIEFLADAYYRGGDILRTDECITEGGDYPFIYQSARLGNFSYQFRDLPPGDYFVDLHFVEIINTYGPKGIRVFNVYIQDEKVLSDFDIFAVVGANKPLQLVDSRTSVKEEGTIILRFEGIHGSPVVSGICIRRAPNLADSQQTDERLRCHNCAAEIEAPLAQEKDIRMKSMAKYKKKIEELNQQCQRKTDECYQAWMSLTAANEQLEKVRMELDNRLFQTYSLDQTVEEQAQKLRALSEKYEHDKTLWVMAISGLEEKIKEMREDHSQLSREAHDCTDSIPDLTKMVSAVQMLVAQCEELKEKYIEEQKKRKKLFNEIQEAKGNIRVFCRCRPPSKKEITAGYANVVDFSGAKDGELGVLTSGSTKKTFKFDRVFTPDDDQVDVFADACPMATSVLDGFNVCIFAYGQTGTGKTFTMEGTVQNRGVNYRTVEQLFRIVEERSDTFSYDISVSVLEVYNEQIRDLLDISTSKRLEIKQSSEGSHHIPGIVEAKVDNIKQVWQVLQAGSNARAVGSNNVNEHSSRSHCMLCILVKAKNLMNGECTKSKLWLVDLAGSERLAKTDVQGERLKEAQNINRSLSALGDVISALANKSSHIPYRNSKLTHLLQDSLGGDSKTLMFVQISPSEHDLGETVSSLNFASRVRGVELAPAKRQIDTSELQKTKMLLEKARQESKCKDESIRKLEESLQNMENKTRSKDQIYRNQQEKIRELEEQLEVKSASDSQTEKQLLQLQERLRGKEETCSILQQKVKQLENKLREQQQNDSAVLQQVRDLEKKLKEQEQHFEAHSLTLQQRIKELEDKLQQECSRESCLLHQKIKELEEKIKEKEQQLEHRVASMDYGEVAGATPIGGRPSALRDEAMGEVDPFILRSSNSSSHRASHGSTMAKRGEVVHEARRKREFRSGETENQMPGLNAAALHDKRIRKSDPPKTFSRVMKTTTRPAAGTQRPLIHSRVSRDNAQVTKDKDAKKKMWC